MNQKNIYINGLGAITPQKTFDNLKFLDELVNEPSNQLKCQDPNYKDYISGDLVRRMSRIIKMGIASSKICLTDAACLMPDAIITGTGLGCIEDTEKFLSAMIQNNEEFLTPTSFIQSTHNTVSAQIALLLKCHNYNFTFVNRGISFEGALTDAMIRIRMDQSSTVLLGGIDEMTKNSFGIMERLGHWKRKPTPQLSLLDDKTRGSIAGQGSVFFLLADRQGENTYAKVISVETFFNPSGDDEILSRVQEFIDRSGIASGDIDLVILGLNGDPSGDRIYHRISGSMFPETAIAYYKHLCGDYMTASAFSMWLAARIMKSREIPPVVLLNEQKPGKLKNILLYNHYQKLDHSLMLISQA